MFHPEGPTLLELARQALSSTEHGYDLIAPKFDLTPFRTPDELLEAVAPFVGRPASALDLCCGTGAGLRMLRPRCRERVVGVDFSHGMLAEARRRLAAGAGGADVELVHGDVLELAYDAEFDLVTCFGAVGHFRRREQPRLVAAAARALRSGGRLLVVTAERLPPPWSWRLWFALGFNAAMAARNAVVRPPFVMYYLTFLLPRARRLLAAAGFGVAVRRELIPGRRWLVLVEATRR